ncbi:SAM-dependent methyltransferase [Streptomyces buecherae]|uniref:SAM-dependent methyltransferase n=1 Tax=Streptomyces buecherae TaxID=2763006 RepID=UPI0036AEC0E6
MTSAAPAQPAEPHQPAPSDRHVPTGVDPSVPHSARVWDCLLGGKNHYAADRQAAAAFEAAIPKVRAYARSGRGFLTRGVRYLAAEAGVRQFLDVGAGLPTAYNTHEIAQSVAPRSRVVYVDHDPMVLLHVGALLTSTPEGATAYVEADMRDTTTVIEAAGRTLDLSRPVGLVLSDVLGHIVADDEARAVVRRLVTALPAGSYLALSHAAPGDPAAVAAQEAYNESGAIPYVLRDRETIARFFEGWELVEPGLVTWPRWRPDAATEQHEHVPGYAAVARVP